MIGKLIWGGILILIGFSFIVKALWGIDIPIIKPLLGLFLMYLGISMIFAPSEINYSYKSTHNGIVTEDTTVTHEYNVIFSKQTIDVSHIKPVLGKKTTVKINTVMGSTKVITDPSIPTKFSVNTAFAHATVPNSACSFFGECEYQTGDDSQPTLFIILNVVLGSLTLVEKK
jgi:hypothetical protein